MVRTQVLTDDFYVPRKIWVEIAGRLIISHTGMPVASDASLQMYTCKQKTIFQIKIYIAVVPDRKGWISFFFFFYSPLLDLGECGINS